MVATVASQIVASILKSLGPIGEAFLVIWQGICSAGEIVAGIFGADLGSACDAADVRRRLSVMDNHTIGVHAWEDGDEMCDNLVRMYSDYTWGEMRPIEKLNVLECIEMRAIMVKMSAILEVPLPKDLLYNWKRKFYMMREMLLGVMVYVNHDTAEGFMRDWDRHELPRYWLKMWSHMKMDIPWMQITDEAILKSIKHVPEVHSIYKTSKNALVEMHQIWVEHELHYGVELPQIKGFNTHELKKLILGESPPFTIKVEPPVKAWGLHTDLGNVGTTTLNCTIADNFVDAMVEATKRVKDYYEGPFVDNTVPNFVSWLSNKTITPTQPVYVEKTIDWSVDGIFDWVGKVLMYEFEKCEAHHIQCQPDQVAERLGRINEALLYSVFTGAAFAIIALITGVSLFPLIAVLFLAIVFGHVWNYRYRCRLIKHTLSFHV